MVAHNCILNLEGRLDCPRTLASLINSFLGLYSDSDKIKTELPKIKEKICLFTMRSYNSILRSPKRRIRPLDKWQRTLNKKLVKDVEMIN